MEEDEDTSKQRGNIKQARGRGGCFMIRQEMGTSTSQSESLSINDWVMMMKRKNRE